MARDVKAAKAMAESLIEEYRPTAQGHELDPERVRALVAKDPEAVAEAIPGMIAAARATGAGIWGLLVETARIFADVHGDDSLAIAVAAAMDEAGVKPPGRRLEHRPLAPGEQVDDGPRLLAFRLALDDVRSGSAFRMVKVFSFTAQTRATLERLIGQVVLEFPLDHDPRPLWEIPEVRRFMLDLHRRLPYFPMYLNPDPRVRTFMVYFGPISEPGAVRTTGDTAEIDLAHPSVLVRVWESLAATRALCAEHGLDFQRIATNILSSYPPTLCEPLLATGARG